jgi:hypothetical protein
MNGVPQELIFVVVGAALLLQFLLRQWRRSVAAAADADRLKLAAAAEARQPPEPEPESTPVSVDQPQPGVAVPLWVATPPPELGPVPMPRPMRGPSINAIDGLPPRRSTHRYSRAALMPDRRAVRKAFVINAILQPCHAHRPPGAD